MEVVFGTSTSGKPTMIYQNFEYVKGWRGGATGKAFGLAINRLRVQILLEVTLRNNLGQVVHTYVLCHQAV